LIKLFPPETRPGQREVVIEIYRKGKIAETFRALRQALKRGLKSDQKPRPSRAAPQLKLDIYFGCFSFKAKETAEIYQSKL
jgi:hypothetical protein